MSRTYYIASCVFTAQFPELSFRIQNYVEGRFSIPVVRCCVPKYKLKEFEERLPQGAIRDSWRCLPDSAPFQQGDTVYSLCHNCSNIIEEMRPGVNVKSLWELIMQDDSFPFPDHSGMRATIQDCWRARERREEQDAVRELLRRMHIVYMEAEQNRENTRYCGSSLLRPQPTRNPKVAPRHYKTEAAGLFLPHTEAEQIEMMKNYCSAFQTETVICYCHYCLEGLLQGGKDGRHIAQLLFPS